MDEQEVQRQLADKAFQEKVFANLMEVFVLPEIRSRQEKGDLPKPYRLRAAQVLIYPDERPTEVRLNEEVNAIANMTLKPDVDLKPGDPVYGHQLETVSNFQLTEADDPDCAHIILVEIGGRWIGNFNFIYNKGLSQKHITTARQFIQTAEYAFKNRHWPVFVDNLFSASELAAKAQLLGYYIELRDSKKHSRVHSTFNLFARLGNVEEDQRKVFNKLSHLRPNVRYLHNDFEVDESEAQWMLTTVQMMIAELESYFSQFE